MIIVEIDPLPYIYYILPYYEILDQKSSFFDVFVENILAIILSVRIFIKMVLTELPLENFIKKWWKPWSKYRFFYNFGSIFTIILWFYTMILWFYLYSFMILFYDFILWFYNFMILFYDFIVLWFYNLWFYNFIILYLWFYNFMIL